MFSGIPQFVSKWQKFKLSERAGSHSHFIELCGVLGQETPTAGDADGTTYTFEKGITKNSGEKGFADVWKRSYFAWEYKTRGKDLADAYQQLLKYREALENPPLLVVCDFDRFEVHTNWTNTPSEVYAFSLQDLLPNEATSACKVAPLEVLHSIFANPGRLKPGQTTAQVTTDAAMEFGLLADSLRNRGVSADRTAQYLMRLLFCLFAEGMDLLPDNLFTRLIEGNRRKPPEFVRKLRQLFAAMSRGGSFGADDIPYFDGGLFMDDEAYELAADDLSILSRAAKLDWAAIEPAIFGTLFERILDPTKRSQIGGHYTSKEDILLIIDAVLMSSLRRRWAEIQKDALAQMEVMDRGRKPSSKTQKKLSDLLNGFAVEVGSVRVLDPACGSGNFLYLAMKRLLDLEKEISIFASSNGLSRFFIRCRPEQLYGIESNIYAHEIASVAIWIGFLQWQRDNGVIVTDNPIMQPLENIRQMDAVLCRDKNGSPTEPAWPEVDVIIGNPPFLGGNRIRQELGDEYVDGLFKLYKGRVPAFADLVCYWHERARKQIERSHAKRAGLLATQGVRGGANRKVLDRIKETGDIFWAESDREWTLDGAAVHVSMIGFDDGSEPRRILNGREVKSINSNLTAGADTTCAVILLENRDICFMGASPKAHFDIPERLALEMVGQPVNVNGRSNSDVVRPVMSAVDLVRRSRHMWTIDFGIMPLERQQLSMRSHSSM